MQEEAGLIYNSCGSGLLTLHTGVDITKGEDVTVGVDTIMSTNNATSIVFIGAEKY